MKTVVTGATGLVGGNLAVELIARGHAVRATRRPNSKVSHLADQPIEWVNADVSDPKSLALAFAGAEAVFHCAAVVNARKKATEDMVRTNVDGVRHVIRAAKEAGVRRLVHCSTVNAVGLSEDGKPCTEEARWNFPEHGMSDGYTVTKHEAELVLAREGSEVDWVVANPTYMFGPYDVKPSSGKLIVDVVRENIPGYPPGANNFVDVRDVVRGMILVLEKGKRGERYILGGDNLPYREIFERIARVANVRAPSRALPRGLANAVGFFGDMQELLFDKEPLLNSVAMKFGFCKTFQFSSAKAERELGYTHGPLEPAIADAITFFRKSGVLRG